MEQFEQIRRDHAREGLSIRELARRHGVHRRAVRQALESAIPPPKRSPESRPAPKLGPYRPVIDEILEADREAPRKQRHTARRIWQRLVEEHGAVVSERQVCRYVHDKRRELGEVGEVFVPLISDAGVEARGRLGAGEGAVARRAGRGAPVRDAGVLLGRRVRDGVPGSETQQAFLEGHVRALEWHGGVFDCSEVRQSEVGGRAGAQGPPAGRVRPVRGVALALPVRELVLPPGRQGAHEKGGVEGDIGRFRRRHLVPVPEVSSIEELNELLEEACWEDLDRTITGQTETVGQRRDRERLLAEHAAARAAPDLGGGDPAGSTAKALATVRTNRYSVPASLAGLKIRARIGAGEISFWHDGKQVARHERLHGHHQISAQARSLPRSAGAQAGRARPVARVAPGARPRRLAGLFR